jgi:hypothetical protein
MTAGAQATPEDAKKSFSNGLAQEPLGGVSICQDAVGPELNMSKPTMCE